MHPVTVATWRHGGEVRAGELEAFEALDGHGLQLGPGRDAFKFVRALANSSCLDGVADGTVEVVDLGPDDQDDAVRATWTMKFERGGTYLLCYKTALGSYLPISASNLTVLAAPPTGWASDSVID